VWLYEFCLSSIKKSIFAFCGCSSFFPSVLSLDLGVYFDLSFSSCVCFLLGFHVGDFLVSVFHSCCLPPDLGSSFLFPS
jgi:hypothetical protein